ncbi:innexin-11-like [Haliotis rufescens]|uniref:innexin-11-like n=1 Tax=Haliotis rufescens TaxID=6454 RepID=UPI00201F44AB|nr:innexin-11-like [Haliotis rufescens]XP_046335747.2 innexin-11-like [Haliotis rufescens]
MFWKRRRDEDDVDRLNRIWTLLILVVVGIAAIVYIAVFPDSAITCLPADEQTKAGTLHYALKYCLDEGSFNTQYYDENTFSYHTFVPLFMFYQAFAFIAPHLLAQFLKRLLGSDSEFLFLCAENCKPDTSSDATFMSRVASPPAPSIKNTVIFMLKKALYLLNSFIQLVIIAMLFSPDKPFNTIRDRYSKGTSETPFPRYAKCRFDIQGESTQHYQCALHINALYLKVYMFLFYWLLILAVANLVSLIVWVLLLHVPRLTAGKIKLYTLTSGVNDSYSPEKQQAFVQEYLGKDYLLNILLAQSTDREPVAADLTMKLWQSYKQTPSPEVETSQM